MEKVKARTGGDVMAAMFGEQAVNLANAIAAAELLAAENEILKKQLLEKPDGKPDSK